MVQLLLEYGASTTLKKPSGEITTVLHYALSRPEPDLNAKSIELLLDANPDLVNTTGPQDWTPLHFCAEHQGLEVARMLIERGADVNALDTRGRSPMTILLGVKRYWTSHAMYDLLKSSGAQCSEVAGDVTASSPMDSLSLVPNSEVSILHYAVEQPDTGRSGVDSAVISILEGVTLPSGCLAALEIDIKALADTGKPIQLLYEDASTWIPVEVFQAFSEQLDQVTLRKKIEMSGNAAELVRFLQSVAEQIDRSNDYPCCLLYLINMTYHELRIPKAGYENLDCLAKISVAKNRLETHLATSTDRGALDTGRNGRASREQGLRKSGMDVMPPVTVRPQTHAENDELNDNSVDSTERKYCYCHRPAYGDMVPCFNPGCEEELFHLGCTDLDTLPGEDETWFCAVCRAEPALEYSSVQEPRGDVAANKPVAARRARAALESMAARRAPALRASTTENNDPEGSDKYKSISTAGNAADQSATIPQHNSAANAVKDRLKARYPHMSELELTAFAAEQSKHGFKSPDHVDRCQRCGQDKPLRVLPNLCANCRTNLRDSYTRMRAAPEKKPLRLICYDCSHEWTSAEGYHGCPHCDSRFVDVVTDDQPSAAVGDSDATPNSTETVIQSSPDPENSRHELAPGVHLTYSPKQFGGSSSALDLPSDKENNDISLSDVSMVALTAGVTITSYVQMVTSAIQDIESTGPAEGDAGEVLAGFKQTKRDLEGLAQVLQRTFAQESSRHIYPNDIPPFQQVASPLKMALMACQPDGHLDFLKRILEYVSKMVRTPTPWTVKRRPILRWQADICSRIGIILNMVSEESFAARTRLAAEGASALEEAVPYKSNLAKVLSGCSGGRLQVAKTTASDPQSVQADATEWRDGGNEAVAPLAEDKKMSHTDAPSNPTLDDVLLWLSTPNPQNRDEEMSSLLDGTDEGSAALRQQLYKQLRERQLRQRDGNLEFKPEMDLLQTLLEGGIRRGQGAAGETKEETGSVEPGTAVSPSQPRTGQRQADGSRDDALADTGGRGDDDTNALAHSELSDAQLGSASSTEEENVPGGETLGVSATEATESIQEAEGEANPSPIILVDPLSITATMTGYVAAMSAAIKHLDGLIAAIKHLDSLSRQRDTARTFINGFTLILAGLEDLYARVEDVLARHSSAAEDATADGEHLITQRYACVQEMMQPGGDLIVLGSKLETLCERVYMLSLIHI